MGAIAKVLPGVSTLMVLVFVVVEALLVLMLLLRRAHAQRDLCTSSKNNISLALKVVSVVGDIENETSKYIPLHQI